MRSTVRNLGTILFGLSLGILLSCGGGGTSGGVNNALNTHNAPTVTAPVTQPVSAAPATQASALEGAEAFSAARLAALQAEGRPVFVDMTAAWCVTCIVNERVALAPASVRQAFKAKRVAYLVGDWTRQDPDITAFLQGHGRDGVPLYVFYPGNGGPPTVLPQILTLGIVLDAITGAPG